LVTFVLVCKSKAHGLVTNPVATRRMPPRTPADYQMPYEDVAVTSDDGLRLVGWWIPPAGRGVVMMVPGYKGHRGHLLAIARLFRQHGYGSLLLTTRAQDASGGELISFGARELGDLDAWLRYTRSRRDVDLSHLAMLGVSLGGQIAIRFTAEHREIRALVADCAFSSVEDTVATSVRHFANLPAFPFAPMLLFWMQREAGFRAVDLDARPWIARIAPRPVFVMQGGADEVISPSSGRALYEAAGDPKEFWFEPSVGHTQFFDAMPQEYERRVIGFFDRSLPAAVARIASFRAPERPRARLGAARTTIR
jgi:alpha-beta hydrolase superfamily lysophospholipase